MKSALSRRDAISVSMALASTLCVPNSSWATTGSTFPAPKPRGPRPQMSEARLRALGLLFTSAAYTASTAPHRLSREVLAGVRSGIGPSPFVNQIEQNFARMDPARASRFMVTLQDRELKSLAQSYANACAVRLAHTPKLHDLLAMQFTPAQLGRISEHFGFAPLYEAVLRSAPEKAVDFLRHSNPNYLAPTPDAGAFAGSVSQPSMNSGVPPLGPLAPYVSWLDYTPLDIYLTFRTSPNIGLLSVTSSLTATVAVYWGAIGIAWGFGYSLAGPVVANFIQWISPSLWNDIGGTVNQIFENWNIDLSTTTDIDTQVAYTGLSQRGLAGTFQVPNLEQEWLGVTGGDYGALSPWSYHAYDYPNFTWQHSSSYFGYVGNPPPCANCQWP